MALTAVAESLVHRATLVELDPDVASVWSVILNGYGPLLASRITKFEFTPANVQAALDSAEKGTYERAFATILRNRISRGGIMAPGAGIVKNGENGRGIASRWYPQTLRKRLLDIVALKHRMRFFEGDGIEYVRRNAKRPEVVFFIDPPYVVAGRRLYAHSDIDHGQLFETVSHLTGDFLMTYDCTAEIRSLAARYGFVVREVAMKNTHHERKTELLISRNLDWMGDPQTPGPASPESVPQMSLG